MNIRNKNLLIVPDWSGLQANIRRQGTPKRVFYFEHGIAESALKSLAHRFQLWRNINDSDSDAALRRRLAVHQYLGQELFRVFPPNGRVKVPSRERGWVEEHRGAVTNEAEYDAFPWPRAQDVDLRVMEQLEALQPDNMRAFHVIDIWETVRDLMGFETFCIALYENPELVERMFHKIGGFAVETMKMLCEFDTFGAIYLADDLGHKTGLIAAPEHIRKFVMPWHRRLAHVAHAGKKLFLFHSCGQMYDLIDEYIEDIGIDAKHSFEDAVLPVEKAKRIYGGRLSMLGGMDVDFLARSNFDAIRRRTREILEACHTGGGYCLGLGNWVTDYIPIENYLAMLEEARNFSASLSAP